MCDLCMGFYLGVPEAQSWLVSVAFTLSGEKLRDGFLQSLGRLYCGYSLGAASLALMIIVVGSKANMFMLSKNRYT